MDEDSIAMIIARQVSWFNGWKASDEAFQESCRTAARNILRAIARSNKKHSSTAPVVKHKSMRTKVYVP